MIWWLYHCRSWVSYWPRRILFTNFVTAVGPLLTLRFCAGEKRSRVRPRREGHYVTKVCATIKLKLWLFWVMTRRNNVGMIRRFGISFPIPFSGLLKQKLFLFYRAWGWDRKYLSKRRIIPTILRCVIIQKNYNIRKEHYFHNNLIKFRRKQRQQGWGQNYSRIWLPKFSRLKGNNFWGKVMKGPSVFWLCYPALYIYIYIYIFFFK